MISQIMASYNIGVICLNFQMCHNSEIILTDKTFVSFPGECVLPNSETQQSL